MAAPVSRLSAPLQRFSLDGVCDTGITVGDGAYATVLQYDFRGLKCVGKKIHRMLYELATPAQRADMLQRFEEECELLGRLHHPNIVQFLGVYVETGSELPVLVMEYLPTNLSGYLDRHDVLPTEINYGILRDVALGLHYLHEYSPPIVHRDLSANNVLLTASLSAKISDLGVAKILNITPFQMTHKMSTKAPGTPCYMPPEALISRPRYTRKIDSYSFGVMILHVLCGQWPFPTDAFQCDSRNPDVFVPVTEVDRRARFLQQMGRDHPLSGLVRQCLSNAPNQRPESADILQQINTALSQVPAPAETVFQQLEGLRSENQRQGSEIQRLENETQRLGNENQSIMTEVQGLRIETQKLVIENQGLDNENQSLRTKVQRLRSENQRQRSEIQRLENETQRLGNENQGIMIEVQGLKSENQRLEIENQGLDNENQSFRTEVQSLRRENQTLREHSQTQPSSSGATINQPLTHEVERLSVCDLGPPVRAVTNSTESQVEKPTLLHKLKRLFVSDSSLSAKDSTESQLHPGVRLQWRRCADAPVGMTKAQAIVVGEKVYVGGGLTTSSDDANQVYLYNRRGDTWSTLPPCPVKWFGMAYFMGRITTVGGWNQQNSSSTNTVYLLREESQQWEVLIISMPTARYYPSVATTSVAIIAAGGALSAGRRSSVVEVYSNDTSQWYTADPLPKPCAMMSSVTINDVWYLLGGYDRTSFVNDCWCVPLDSLVHKAVSHSASASVWYYLPPTPLKVSTAACLSGSLVAVGGNDDKTRSSAVYGFMNSSWVRLSNGDLPSLRSSCTTAQLSPLEVIVIGGWDDHEQYERSKTVLTGALHL